MNREDVATVLHQYSEWLDSEGLIRGENDGDVRAYDALVAQFISERPENYSPRIPAASSNAEPMLADLDPRSTRTWLRLMLLPITAATIVGAIVGGLLGWVEWACDED